MPIWVKSDDVRSGRKAKALDGRLRAAQELMVKECHNSKNMLKIAKWPSLRPLALKNEIFKKLGFVTQSCCSSRPCSPATISKDIL